MEFKGQKYTKKEAVQLVRECYDIGEPVFIIRGRDYVSEKAIKAYAELQKNAAGPDTPETKEYKHAEKAEKFAVEVLNWKLENLALIKIAD
jgi:hypothetical protein